jgi:hypothetical protein
LYDPQIGRFISADTIVPRPGDLQSLNRYSYCVNNPLVYTDPTGHGDVDQGWSTDGTWADSGSPDASNYDGWTNAPNVTGVVPGIIEVGKGTVNVVVGLVTLDPDRIGQGFAQIGRGIMGVIEGTVKDAVGFAIGQASHLITFPLDVYDLGKSLFDGKRGTTIAALGTTLYDLAVPRNALNGGAGYGWSIDSSGKETNTWGAFFANMFLGAGDKTNLGHDKDENHGKWVMGQMNVIFSGRTTGVFELAYAIVGIPAFSVAAGLQALGLLPPPNY